MASFDLILHGGAVIDGTGGPARRADLGLRGDRIAAVGDLARAEARERIDAAGHAVAPGFIDVHNHTDGWLLKFERFEPKLAQGYTTEVIAADGIGYAPVSPETARHWIQYLRSLNGLKLDDYDGWLSLDEYLARIDRRAAQNVATHVPFGNLRSMAVGWGREPADDTQMLLMKRELRKGFEAGGVGLSTGLDYVAQCFAGTREIAELCTAMAPEGGLYVTHIRYKLGHLPALKEAVEIARFAGVPLHVSHLKGENPAQGEKILEFLDSPAAREVDLTFDVYPYGPSSTMLNFMLPYEAWENGPLGVARRLNDPVLRARFGELLAGFRMDLDELFVAWTATKDNAAWQGLNLTAFAKKVGKPLPDALADLLIEEQLAVLMVIRHGTDALAEPFVAHPRGMLGSDGIWLPGGQVHPRVYGSAARVLGPWVREKKLFTLEQAVHKLSGFPARRFGLLGRGELREGAFADLVVFDPAAVGDPSTYDEPNRLAAGVRDVFVNGMAVRRGGIFVDGLGPEWPGRRLYFKR
ncbi:MAG: D-aminoacylase [Planctomycetota bacterium]|nr:D-aminoacylase [Planctomycetota bacterium]